MVIMILSYKYCKSRENPYQVLRVTCSHIQVLTPRGCPEWNWISCPGSILVGDWYSHLVLHSRESVHHLLSCIALQLVLLGYSPIGELYCECQGLCSLVCMLMCQRPCDLHLGAWSVWYAHIGWKGRGNCRGDTAWDLDTAHQPYMSIQWNSSLITKHAAIERVVYLWRQG